MSRLTAAYPAPQLSALDATSRDALRDLHVANPAIFWTDLLISATLGWGAFAMAVMSRPWSITMWLAALVSSLALYRCLCFTHEITHLRRGSVVGFESFWNATIGVPLLLPSFAYVGVHQSHHSLSTYGTKDDPEYLPFARSRGMLIGFAIQSSVVLPILLFVRFVLMVPFALLLPPFHRWLEVHASSFSMNPHYRRVVAPTMASTMRRWETALFLAWSAAIAMAVADRLPWRLFALWLGMMVFVSFLNTLRVLGAHEYDSDGRILDRHEQLADSIDTPGGPWTALWAPVGLRYHALHHFFPGIPYHNLGEAYRRLMARVECREPYCEQTSPSLRHSLVTLFARSGASRTDVPAQSEAVRHRSA